MTDLRLGKKPATYDKRDLLFDHFRTSPDMVLPVAPIGYGVDRDFGDWGMLGNDEWGDCAWAGPCHEHMLWTKIGTGTAAEFTTDNALAAYSGCTGFDRNAGPPDNNPTDQGTDMRQGLLYRQKVGITDAAGVAHRIGGFCALEPGNWQDLMEALNIFDAVAIGFEMPGSAMDQFQNGKVWKPVHGSHIEGGHYTPAFARPSRLRGSVVTWGKRQDFSEGFYKKFNDESYGVFSVETLKNGKSPQGFDLAQFNEALKEL